MVDYVLEIAKEMGVENVYAIMLPDNYRALNLTKKMGFNLEYLADGTVKGVLDLKEEILKLNAHHQRLHKKLQKPHFKKRLWQRAKKYHLKNQKQLRRNK